MLVKPFSSICKKILRVLLFPGTWAPLLVAVIFFSVVTTMELTPVNHMPWPSSPLPTNLWVVPYLLGEFIPVAAVLAGIYFLGVLWHIGFKDYYKK